MHTAFRMMMCSAGVVWLRRAARTVFVVWGLTIPGSNPAHGVNLTLAWDYSTDPTAAGYNVYYGTNSRAYNSTVSAGNTNFATISNLVSGTTYYFAATTYNAVGLESDFSVEIAYAPPAVSPNVPPTLDPIDGLVIKENAGLQTIQLTGIGSGSTSEIQALTVSAFSSNPGLIPNPAVNYTSPNSTGSLSLTPVTGAFGTATLTVMVDDGGAVSNTIIRTLTITVTPINDPPTLDPIDNLVINQNSGPQIVPLTGITGGNPNENQTVTITATSGNSSLIPNPVVSYTSPNTSGTLAFTPIATASGSALITVVASDGQTANATTTRSFNVTVNQVVSAGAILTNTTIVPKQTFRFALYPPNPNGDALTYSLDAAAPAGAAIINRRGVPIFTWTPTSAYASTTNLIIIHVNDTTKPALSTNQAALVTVLDYLEVSPISSAVEAGQTASLPICVSSSEGATNLSFNLSWPNNLFGTPTLTIPASSKVSGSITSQGTSLLVKISSDPNRVMTGSNVVAQLTFLALSSQPSAFVKLEVTNVSGRKPTGATYAYCTSQKARLAVVKDQPLLEWGGTGSAGSILTYGKIGTNYTLQSSSNLLLPAAWSTAITYKQTNVLQSLRVDTTQPLRLFRLKQE
ncbi:MAG TPA: hypothetical protein VJA21_07200 [Verrucomicrobiae bacterium]